MIMIIIVCDDNDVSVIVMKLMMINGDDAV